MTDEAQGAATPSRPARAGARRRVLLGGLLATPWISLASTAGAQSAGPYPNRPVRLIVPYPPGGSVDPVARILSNKLSELWGQRLVIDNRPGAATVIGTDLVAKAPPDGYTLLLTASTHVTNSILFSDLPYDPFRDFTAVGTVYRAEFALIGHPSVPATNLQELIAYARANPGKLNYASAGPGNASHIAGEVFSRMTGVEMVHVPYRGGGPLITDLLRGEIQLYFAVPTSVLQPIRQGLLRAYAASGERRLAILPETPTFAEAGLPGYSIRSWIGVWAPANTPEPIVSRLSADLARVLATEDVRERLEAQGQVAYIASPQEMLQAMREEGEAFARIVREANIQVER
jgi:tripartite-type tricarboxylate transporter receptor subunit TctC